MLSYNLMRNGVWVFVCEAVAALSCDKHECDDLCHFIRGWGRGLGWWITFVRVSRHTGHENVRCGGWFCCVGFWRSGSPQPSATSLLHAAWYIYMPAVTHTRLILCSGNACMRFHVLPLYAYGERQRGDQQQQHITYKLNEPVYYNSMLVSIIHSVCAARHTFVRCMRISKWPSNTHTFSFCWVQMQT